jgi:hypothetical protein
LRSITVVPSKNSGILIIGSGFACVWAAAAASRVRALAGLGDPDMPVTIVSDRRDLVIRPRLYEAGPHRMRVPLRDLLDPVEVRQVHATVTGITPPDGRDRDGPTSAPRPGRPGRGRAVRRLGDRDKHGDLDGEAAKALKKAICESYIYPPVHDADALLAGAARRPHPAIFT